MHLHRRILVKFPRFQHRPSLIKASKTLANIPSEPYKRWNFRKVDWKLYSLITNTLSQDLPSPDSSGTDEAYRDFCNTIITSAKQSSPRGRRKNYTLCWDAQCEHLYQAFLDAPQGQATNTAVSALHDRLDEKRKTRWSEAVNSIDFTHSSRLAWSTKNNLTGKQRHTQRTCPISSNSIASELVKNGTYKTNDRKSARLPKRCLNFGRFQHPTTKLSQEILHRKNFPMSSVCSSQENFRALTLLVFYAGAALKSWLNQFQSSCMRTL